jgi:hypothetical protein
MDTSLLTEAPILPRASAAAAAAQLLQGVEAQ